MRARLAHLVPRLRACSRARRATRRDPPGSVVRAGRRRLRSRMGTKGQSWAVVVELVAAGQSVCGIKGAIRHAIAEPSSPLRTTAVRNTRTRCGEYCVRWAAGGRNAGATRARKSAPVPLQTHQSSAAEAATVTSEKSVRGTESKERIPAQNGVVHPAARLTPPAISGPPTAHAVTQRMNRSVSVLVASPRSAAATRRRRQIETFTTMNAAQMNQKYLKKIGGIRSVESGAITMRIARGWRQDRCVSAAASFCRSRGYVEEPRPCYPEHRHGRQTVH